jgi:hypothetical protein
MGNRHSRLTKEVSGIGNTSLIADLIGKAAAQAHREDAERAVAWVYGAGWRIPDDEYFGEILAGYGHLTDGDRAELHAYRVRLLEERQTA